MRGFSRTGFILAVCICIAAGYAARVQTDYLEARRAQVRMERAALQGTRVAAANLVGTRVDLQPLETLIFVVNNLREHYVERITEELEGKMAHGALAAMLAQLDDPNTRFLSPEQRSNVEMADEGVFHGIGAILGIKRVKSGSIVDEHLIVVTPLWSGPAEEAGLKPGDDIIAVNGRDVLPFDPYKKAGELAKSESNRKVWSPELKKKMEEEKKRIENGIPILEAENLLSSRDEGEIELLVARKGVAEPIKLKITPRKFTVDPVMVSFKDNGKIGILRINYLGSGAADEAAEAVRKFHDAGVSGIVVDLRGSAGGRMEAMLDVAGRFAPGRRLGILAKSRGRKSDVMIPRAPRESVWRGRMAVLVDRGTARTAEMLAAALRDLCGAKLVGEQTYGDFAYTTLVEQKDGSAVEFTSGVVLMGAGANYNTKGVPVDVQVASAGQADAAVSEAVKILSAARGS